MARNFWRLRSKICATVWSRANSSILTPSMVLAVPKLETTMPTLVTGTAIMAADTVSPPATAASARRDSLASTGGKSVYGSILTLVASLRLWSVTPSRPEIGSPGALRWIRGAFLDDDTDHGCVVVHGHTISADVDERPNRVGWSRSEPSPIQP